ncbi:hypothetical protein [Spiroplasma floricola]|uniref:Uncharacterized protein n=1 Tax=Spiroplasma floricola 23-6 TaxID=1336749 RepID=A0A2K8SEZ5_9MOLU|nr:hypothetical protein [Spiroplasma floricola]AUB32011.1 hypothetical protein SFLOR_v1c09630 [Spiroplasma floricola 23-6]
MTIKELTNLYGEQFYALELISNKDYKTLEPFKWQGDNNKLKVISFRVICNEKTKYILLQVIIDFAEYSRLKKFLKKENLDLNLKQKNKENKQMNKKKRKWINEVFNMISKKLTDAKIIFQSSEESNKFYFGEDNNNFLIWDLIIETSKGWFIFKMLTNNKYEYRFSIKNKYFYKLDLQFFDSKENKKMNFNWVEFFKLSKQNLDKNNGMYNKFLLLADYINFEASEKGIYGVTLNSFQNLLEFLN